MKTEYCRFTAGEWKDFGQAVKRAVGAWYGYKTTPEQQTVWKDICVLTKDMAVLGKIGPIFSNAILN